MTMVVGASKRVIWFSWINLSMFLAAIVIALFSIVEPGWEELGRFSKGLVLITPFMALTAAQAMLQIVFSGRLIEVHQARVTLRHSLPFRHYSVTDIDKIKVGKQFTEIVVGKRVHRLINSAHDTSLMSVVQRIRQLKSRKRVD